MVVTIKGLITDTRLILIVLDNTINPLQELRQVLNLLFILKDHIYLRKLDYNKELNMKNRSFFTKNMGSLIWLIHTNFYIYI